MLKHYIPFFIWLISIPLMLAALTAGNRLVIVFGTILNVVAIVSNRWLGPIQVRDEKVAPILTRRYRSRDTTSGRWLEAPVAELDKSTLGKLLASRASRDPSLHVVVRSTPPPVCTDALYDPELDG